MIRTLKIDTINKFYVYNTSVLILFIMLYSTSIHICIFRLPSITHPLPVVTANLLSLFLTFVCFVFELIDLQYYISSYFTREIFDISVSFKMITMINLVIICHRTKIFHSFWLYFPQHTCQTSDSYFATESGKVS